jgi:hypothetical protein
MTRGLPSRRLLVCAVATCAFVLAGLAADAEASAPRLAAPLSAHSGAVKEIEIKEVEKKEVEVPAGAAETVQFFGVEPVILDHPVNGAGEALAPAFMEVNQFANKTAVQWEAATAPAGAKNWPIAYQRAKPMAVEATFKLNPALQKLLTENKLEETTGKPTITGQTTPIFGTALTFTASLTAAALEKDAEGGTLDTGVTTSGGLPKQVGFTPTTITWSLTFETGGMKQTLPLGTSNHNLYLLYNKPKLPKDGAIYFTLLSLASQYAAQATPTETGTIAGVAAGFAQQEEVEVEKKEKRTVPVTRIRNYNPATGAIAPGEFMKYWPEAKASETLEEELKEVPVGKCPELGGAKSLLEHAIGECSTWAEALQLSWGIEGLSSDVKILFVQILGNPEAKPCEKVGNCQMLVNNWQFKGKVGPPLKPFWPFGTSEVIDNEGAPAQGRANPWSVFGNHVIVEIDNKEAGKKVKKAVHEWYDPSYGKGPFDSLLEYQEASIAGFCMPEGEALICQEAPKVLELAAKKFK